MANGSKDPRRLAEALEKAVTDAGPSKGLSGSQVGMLLRLQDPTFDPRDYGAESVKHFIARFVPQLQVIAYTGPDPIYGLPGWSVAHLARPRGPMDLWRCWVSPLSPASFSIERATGAVTTVARTYRQSEGEVKVDPAPLEAHRRMARDFLKQEQLDVELRRKLDQTTYAEDSAWWRQWMQLLRARAPAAYVKWQEFREGALETLLHEALARAGLEENAARVAFEAILATRRQLKLPKDAPVQQEARTRDAAPELVAVVQAVVARLSERELRSLPLPVGLVLDALGVGKAQ